MIGLLEIITGAMALGIVLFGLSQAWLAINYQRSKDKNVVAKPHAVWCIAQSPNAVADL
jgi:hypothetical protein